MTLESPTHQTNPNRHVDVQRKVSPKKSITPSSSLEQYYKEKQQRLREERQAKKSSLNFQHFYLFESLSLVTGLDVDQIVEFLIEGNQIERINSFFSKDGVSTLVFFYQYKDTSKETSLANKAKKKLFLADPSSDELCGLCIYFVYLNKSKEINQQTIHKEINLGIVDCGNDSVIEASSKTLNLIYRPTLLKTNGWESKSTLTDQSHKTKFLNSLDTFIDALVNAQHSIDDAVLLKECNTVDLSQLTTASNIAAAGSNTNTLDAIEKHAYVWIKQIEQVLAESEQMRREVDDVGPKAELGHWKQRLSKFNSLLSEIKSSKCKALVGVLVVAKSKVLKTWRELDCKITDFANEAKDNVKFLYTLEKFCEPLYHSDPVKMVDAIPGLINAIRMVHNYSRYYNTSERMTAIFVKITNQMVTACKNHISEHGTRTIWDVTFDDLQNKFTTCRSLSAVYQNCFAKTKKKIEVCEDEKNFEFSETYIFGKINSLIARLDKILLMIKLLRQFKCLETSHIEGLDAINSKYLYLYTTMRKKNYDYLDFRKTEFDTDFEDFKLAIAEIEVQLVLFMENTIKKFKNIPLALKMLAQFKCLKISALTKPVHEVYVKLLTLYSKELENIMKVYQKQKEDPPVARNMPPIAGKIAWARQLFHRIQEPMELFQENKTLLVDKFGKKVVRNFNKTGKVLMEFEVVYYEAWLKQVGIAKSSFQASVFVRHPQTREIFVNFDPLIFSLMRETECLSKMNLDVPIIAEQFKQSQNMFKDNYDKIKALLSRYQTVIKKINSLVLPLMGPHFTKLDTALEPGFHMITWMSLNIRNYIDVVYEEINDVELLIDRANNTIDIQIEKILFEISSTKICETDVSEPCSINDFYERTKELCYDAMASIQLRNELVEKHVNELCHLLLNIHEDTHIDTYASLQTSRAPSRAKSRLGSAIISPSRAAYKRKLEQKVYLEEKSKELISHFHNLISETIIKVIRTTLEKLRRRILHKSYVFNETTNVLQSADVDSKSPLFLTFIVLKLPNLCLEPSLEEIQKILNLCALEIISISKNLYKWKSDSSVDFEDVNLLRNQSLLSFHDENISQHLKESCASSNDTFFKSVISNKDISKLLASIVSLISSESSNIINVFEKYKIYDHVWVKEKEDVLQQFMNSEPMLDDFVEKILFYKDIRNLISESFNQVDVGPISLSAEKIRFTIETEATLWISLYGRKANMKYITMMSNVIKFIQTYTKRLKQPIKDLDDVRFVMQTLCEVRSEEITKDMNIVLIEDAFSMLTKHNISLSKEDLEKVDTLRYMWKNLVTLASQVQDELASIQTKLREDLLEQVQILEKDIHSFTIDYYKSGPIIPSLSATDASDRLIIYQHRYDNLNRRYTTNCGGEVLFGMPVTEYGQFVQIRKDLKLLQKLYGLYNDVNVKIDSYLEMRWGDVNIDNINDELQEFQVRCRKLPKVLENWNAYNNLRSKIDRFKESCPLLELMRDKSMKVRHWKKIEELINHNFDIESENVVLSNILESPILEYKEEIEDICVAATKEKDIESKVKSVIAEWNNQELSFSRFKNKGELLLKGDITIEIISCMEDSLMILSSLMSNRYNTPFKNSIQSMLSKLSNSSDILENWLLVQNLWIYLEAVFVGGDIARQLPKEAKRFMMIDKSWQKIMQRAHEIPNVVSCCAGDETLKQLLPHLQEQLELCQKSLSGYLEKKRMVFPRFYFVSDPTLLEILGQASDSHTIQDHLLSMFDNIKNLKFHPKDYNKIEAIYSKEKESIKLDKYVLTVGNVEDWLNKLQQMCQKSLHGIIRQAYHAVNDYAFDVTDFLFNFPAQIGLLGIQLLWTRDSTEALMQAKTNRKALHKTNESFLELLNNLIEQTTKNLSKVERSKFETLITIHVHQRDIFDNLVKMHVKSPTDFDWLKQIRFYFYEDSDKCVVSITDVDFVYQNEFLGCTERLVITPLTDRCYITLAQALHLSLGGSPTGPAGTGKTETVKDMGKSLGKYVVVFNCSDQLDYRGLGRIFKGLAMSGSWGCFDEFNRIDLPVLSVAAQQIAVILTCKKEKQNLFTFTDGDTVNMNPEFGLFLTMNPPGYGGRQVLPENLKMQFRTVSMMVPDRQIIIRVKLASCGFLENVVLARKFFTLYKLCEEQLSKQVHYDFGLRNILAVLWRLGETKRDNKCESETRIMMRVLRDMNLSKLVDEDEPLFCSLINDLFPNISLDTISHHELENAIISVCEQDGLVNHPTWKMKLVQLYETQLVRHGMMTLGPSGAGKTTCIQTLMKSLSLCGMPHKEMRMNPKAITSPQMFGRLDAATNDWTDGIFSTLWKKTLKAKKGESIWIVLDGPVDAIWIENLNSVLDDNKTLTLANGDRIPMSPMCKIIFEPHNIDNASPATVSRNGMVYMSSSGLGWKPLLDAWMMKYNKKGNFNTLCRLIEETFQELLNFVFENVTSKMVVLECNFIKQCLVILDGILNDSSDNSFSPIHLNRCYVFAVMWSIGALLELDDRYKLECFLKESLPKLNIPVVQDDSMSANMFEYFVDDSGNWCNWSKKVGDYKFDRSVTNQYSSILVPNVDNVQTNFLLKIIAKQEKAVLLIGEQGTAKSVMIKKFLEEYNAEIHLEKTLNFSSASTPMRFQRAVESYIDKRIGSTYGPVAGKKMTIFIDDINMPIVNKWGDQVTNEIVRQLIEMQGFYNLDKPGDFMTVTDVQFIAAMIHPGGGRNDIPERLKRHFSIFNCTLPSDVSIDKIFGVIVNGHFSKINKFSEQVIQLSRNLVKTTRRVWQVTKINMLPTPSKFHYVFNLRDLSRIWEGVLKATPDVLKNYKHLLLLWKHEMCRVFSDRFIEEMDKDWFEKQLCQICHEDLGNIYDISALNQTPYFADFLRDSPELTGEDLEDDESLENPKIYEPILDFENFKKRLETFLSNHNESVRGKGLELVFFKDAMINLIKISRIISIERGNALLVGVCGSGKQSLTKLASYIASYKTFRITATRNYNISNFLDDLKYLYRVAGLQGNAITFIFSDKDIKDESFLEYLNNILSCSELSNFFPREEMEEITNELVPVMKKEYPRRPPTFDNLYKYFVNRARNNLHVVLCFSPVGEKLRSWALKFPGLVSGCTIVWFQQWPKDALVEVAKHFLADWEANTGNMLKENIINVMGTMHNKVAEFCKKYFERFRRHTHVPPRSYISFLDTFKKVYKMQKNDINRLSSRMNTGLNKLVEASSSVNILSKELIQKEIDLKAASEKADTVLKEVTIKAQAAEKVKSQVQVVKDKAQVIVDSIAADRDIAESKLALAKPALQEAVEALKTIKASDIATVRRLGKPPHLIMRIMDCVLILFQKKIDSVAVDYDRNCIKPSWNESLRFMAQGSFLQSLEQFQKDSITEEMLELVQPYFDAPDYHLENAKRVCGNVAGLCSWTKAMCTFFTVNKEVIPLKDNLSMQEKKLERAMTDLTDAQNQLDEKQSDLDAAQNEYEAQIKKKQFLVEDAGKCRKKMFVASTLIDGLSGEKERWTEQSKHFNEQMGRLAGDVLLGTAFLSYLGPFNQEFRNILIKEFEQEILHQSIPFNDQLDIISLLANNSTLAQWQTQGLPNDELSIQNGIIVSKTSRYPLLIDPQCQGKNWITNKDVQKGLQVTSFKNKNFKTHLEDALSLGQSLLIEDIEEELDPILDEILNNNIIKLGSRYKVKVGDREVDISEDFSMYLTTKLPNPSFSPEVSAKTSIVDFTVTVKGLEDQLLGRVTATEKKELEEERWKLIEGVTENQNKMKELEDNLLGRLTSIQGSLVEDEFLVEVLETTKSTSLDLSRKLVVAKETEIEINKSREEYRAVATRGSILYFLIVEMSNVNCMYQISLDQFLGLFHLSIQKSKSSPITSKRVNSIVEYLTYLVFKYVCRFLYEKDRFLFVLLLALKINIEEKKISYGEFMTFIKGGASLDLKQVPMKPCKWITDIMWLNLVELSKLKSFNGILVQVASNEKLWKKWFDEETPEECQIPDGYNASLDTFRKLLLVRALCPDRTTSQARKFIKESLGLKYTESVILNLQETWEESCPRTPLICFLSIGSDPTGNIEILAKRLKIGFKAVSMGQGQEVHARRLITQAMQKGGWVLLQNCHLCLPFMDELLEIINCDEPSDLFRVWLTTKVHVSFPITLLQTSIKFTNESPQGLKAGLKRTYNGVTQEQLDYVEIPQWKPLLFNVAFLHSAVQERKKYGSLGWNIPYEFNQSDYLCSVHFLQNHLDDMEVRKGVSWRTIRYMLGEVHYGGRVTDDFDKKLLDTFTKVWFNESIFQASFNYYVGYKIPRCSNVAQYLEYIDSLPETDRPEVFGLHANADITYQRHIINEGLDTILNIQPKDSSSGRGITRECYVQQLADDMLEKLPAAYEKHEVRSRLQQLGAYQPINIFLKQEIDRMQRVIQEVRKTLIELKLAIDGSIIMNEILRDALDCIFNARIPHTWKKISWDCSTLGFWFTELIERNQQLITWLDKGRPHIFWMPGFFNPQGFLTAMCQEVTRNHKGWSLDNVSLQNDVLTINKNDITQPPDEGVYIHGLFLEGAAWSKQGNRLIEAPSKVLFSALPVVHVNASNVTNANEQNKTYKCPIYKKVKRSNDTLIATLDLNTTHPPEHWVLRGVALLCDIK